MSADFWAGYLSGAVGIIIGNPLDVIKVRLQANARLNTFYSHQFESKSSLVRGAAAPILTHGALNALLFTSYNRCLTTLEPRVQNPTEPLEATLGQIWLAGAVGGMVSWLISSPTELVKCRAQMHRGTGAETASSWEVAKSIVRSNGVKGLYFGGGVTSVRDAVGYGFYFWSYELCKRMVSRSDETAHEMALKTLLCGGIAGIVTWASVFPLDAIKTRLQTQKSFTLSAAESRSLLGKVQERHRVLGAWEISKDAYMTGGLRVFYRGLGVCSLRAFGVNAVQWAIYEWMMKVFNERQAMAAI
ncbi:Solute carrier family 25 (Mitochondrial carnitine/acylcarnitine transporter), member 20/29 [Trichophyton interdigitale]|uniref:Solute carrier family 25 (Mitochondrial carnitine/acylcarnitine transporter), member 20/29 n=1 Tax=Trichophyton interdigitale TaxID=101480 RepID=A0A9P4YH05_9EURO|nr:Solute carrier family 25 (Mitochondrial carnitine/acylcarnitine transporter), member 20/29 [Trichophyton interdigitale]KAF3899968.1 Solute carrier family 25 (Mitochondrial carnitine/acylcarnitine transporter), member 20/29 [Trichophyton interdigitale]KAG8209099.1 Solute carrier family 25 (Mitochondrial carnitine/acylcarnitine transporter), member 20/29 [Trichophyton interdigitale]